MTLPGKGYARLLFLSILVIIVLLAGLNIYLNRKLAEHVPIYLYDYSGRLGYGLSVDDTYIDPLFRLRLSGLKIAPASADAEPPLQIKSVRINPSILSSIFAGRIKVSQIYVEAPEIRYDKVLADKLTDLLEGGEEKDGKTATVEIERIKIRNALAEASPGLSLSSEALDILIVKGKALGASEVKVDGDLSVRGVKAEVSGDVNILSGEISGKLDITADKIKSLSMPGSERAADVIARAGLSFKAASGDILSNGFLTLETNDQNHPLPPSGLKYALRYEKSSGVVHVGALEFDILDVINGTFSGDIKDVSGEAVFDLSGSASRGNIAEISKWLGGIGVTGASGSVKADGLKLNGSFKKNDVKLTGKLSLDAANFSYMQDSLKVSGLNCGLAIRQELNSDKEFQNSSTGDCSAASVLSKDIGAIDGISTGVSVNASGGFSKTDIKFTNIKASYMDGNISGGLGLDINDGETKIAGNLNGEGLNLAKAPKSIIPLDMEGSAGSIAADIKGGPDAYGADITFTVSDLLIRSNAGREFKVAKAASGSPVDLEYVPKSPGTTAADDTGNDSGGKLIVKDKGLRYERLSFEDYFIEGGTVEDLAFTLPLGSDWTLSMNSRGSGFSILGKEISLAKFREHLVIERSGRYGFSGTIEGSGGRFNSIDFPAVSAKYIFKGDSVDITGLEAEISTIGAFKTDNVAVLFGEGQGGYPYDISFADGVFSIPGDKLKAEGVSGKFSVFAPGTGEGGWKGAVKANKTSISSGTIESLGADVSPSPNGISISGITGKLMGGELDGRVDIDTSRTPSGLTIGLSLANASVSSGETGVLAGRTQLSFSGALPSGGLPEGTGKLELGNLKMISGGTEYLLNGSLDARTSGETLFIDEGFIRDKEGNQLQFTGEMENTLSGPRRLEVVFPETPLSSVARILAPYIPGTMREGQVSGRAAFRAELRSLFEPDQSWSGNITLRSASYAGYVGGAQLSLRDVNGTVNIKESGGAANKLASLLGTELELSRDIYKEYLRSFQETPPDSSLDNLRIGEIEYGILKFDNVELELEADKDNLSIVRLVSGFFGGKLYAAGLYKYGGAKSGYNFSFLFNDVSLEGISRRLSPVQEYITGRMNGLIWLAGEGGDMGTIDGPFEFWSVSSPKEKRSIGKALLDKLGAKERLILGSNRSYDSGEISGYINDGVITFKKFNISNSVLGIKNLSIQADPVRNSISIAHLVSVIREIARRSQTGGPTIETN